MLGGGGARRPRANYAKPGHWTALSNEHLLTRCTTEESGEGACVKVQPPPTATGCVKMRFSTTLSVFHIPTRTLEHGGLLRRTKHVLTLCRTRTCPHTHQKGQQLIDKIWCSLKLMGPLLSCVHDTWRQKASPLASSYPRFTIMEVGR